MQFDKSIIEGVEIKRCRNTSHAYKAHVHNELSLGYIIEGSTNLSFNEETIHFKTGDGVIIPPLMTHRCAPEEIDQWAYVMLYIDPAIYRDEIQFDKSMKLGADQTRKLMAFIEQLITENDKDILESVLIELLLEFGDTVDVDTSKTDKKSAIKGVHDYIIDHVRDDISLDILEKRFGLNKFTLIRQFKKSYAVTPAAFHLQYRVAEAKRMISEGSEALDVCDSLNFYDQAHFIREFKKMYGITPSAYMKQMN